MMKNEKELKKKGITILSAEPVTDKTVDKMFEKEFSKGSELDKQIYPEGEPTWGCKSGVLDVEDVEEFIKILKEWETNPEFHKFIDKLAGSALI